MFENRIKVITLNVWHFEFMREERAQRIGREILRRNADIVMLQEVPFEDNEKALYSEFLNTIVDITGLVPAIAESHEVKNSTYRDGIVILAKESIKVKEAGWAYKPENLENPDFPHRGVYAVLEKEGHVINVFSIHGAWGGTLAHLREAEVIRINNHAEVLEEKYKDYSPITILGGDLNCNADSASIRFLEGSQSLNNEGAFWVDAWKQCHPDRPNENTLSGDCKLFHMTATKVGIKYSEYNPSRRIDYLFSKGWVYGRPGMPVNAEICFKDEDELGYTVSDHYGLDVDFWLGERSVIGYHSCHGLEWVSNPMNAPVLTI